MKSVLNATFYMVLTRLLSEPKYWPVERGIVERELSGALEPDGIFKVLAWGWALTFLPVTLLSFALEWLSQWLGLSFFADNAGAIMGVPIVGALWCSVRQGASGGSGRPNLGDDAIVLALGLASWLLVPA